MSSPSIQAIGWSVALWWPWKPPPGVSRKSPRRIATGSPLTTVQTPSPSTTNRNAFWLCRCSGAVSCGPRYWMAHHSVGVAYAVPGRPGVTSAMARRSPPAPDGDQVARALGQPVQRPPPPHVRLGRRRRYQRHQVVELGPERREVVGLEVGVELLQLRLLVHLRFGHRGVLSLERVNAQAAPYSQSK